MRAVAIVLCLALICGCLPAPPGGATASSGPASLTPIPRQPVTGSGDLLAFRADRAKLSEDKLRLRLESLDRHGQLEACIEIVCFAPLEPGSKLEVAPDSEQRRPHVHVWQRDEADELVSQTYTQAFALRLRISRDLTGAESGISLSLGDGHGIQGLFTVSGGAR